MDYSTPGSPVLHCLPDFVQIHVHWVSDAIQQSQPPSPLLLLPSIFPSIFFNELAFCLRRTKYWSFQFSISPSNAYSVVISFRIDWFDLLTVQRILQSLLQHHNLKASILWRSAFFTPSLTSVHKAGLCPLLAVWFWTTNVTHLSSGK